MLSKYAQSLRHLDQTEDYVRIGLKVLAKTYRSRFGSSQSQVNNADDLASCEPRDGSEQSLGALLTASKSLNDPVSLPLLDYFDHVHLSSHIQHSQERGAFSLDLHFRSLLPEQFQAESIRAELICTVQSQNTRLALVAGDAQIISPGMMKVMIVSKVGSIWNFHLLGQR